MTDQEKSLWIKLSSELELAGNPSVYKMYSQRMGVKLQPNGLSILCPDGHAISVIEKAFKPLVESFIKKQGLAAEEISFIVGKVVPTKEEKPEAREKKAVGGEPLFANQPITHPTQNQPVGPNGNGVGLSAKYVFENYLMGANNQLAYAVAKAVAERPGEAYNPLFIHSGVGLGKTHLMQAVGNKILTDKPGLKVIYCTGEAFTNGLVEALQLSKGRGQYTMNKFREKFRTADVLLIDDVQFIAGRDSTQEEFFHTFNALYMSQKQIVLTSDKPPKDFTDLEDRIKSRFGSGMIVDIQPPDLDMRIAILRNKRDETNDQIPNDVLDYIALNVKTNVRELLGAYIQIATALKTKNANPTKEFVAGELGQRIPEQNQRAVNLHQILKAVCNYYSVRMEDVKGSKRTKELVVPRHIAMYLIYDLTKTPYMTIAQLFGGRDHTSILHGIKKIEEEVKNVTKTKQDVANIMQNVYTT
ncbi:chromosomal replication initiator protein DnaA [Patescibacteria group bacterium]|nr:chromosomal replication initiator protein DnaA [Patescibacteria group bacterium]MBU1970676.1 chromosomal replication initiator protein DnaA [Patescibacteria group bacterium]